MRDMAEEEDTRLERSFSARESKVEILSFLLKILSQTCFVFLSKWKKTPKHYLDNIGNVGHDIAEHEGFITESRKYQGDIPAANETVTVWGYCLRFCDFIPYHTSLMSFLLHFKRSQGETGLFVLQHSFYMQSNSKCFTGEHRIQSRMLKVKGPTKIEYLWLKQDIKTINVHFQNNSWSKNWVMN